MNRQFKDICWLAGLLEGEGCFLLTNTRQPAIQLSMSDLDVVERAKSICGVDNKINPLDIHRNDRYKIKGNRTIYRLVICSTNAVQWMMTIYSLMSDRRKDKIKKILTEWRNTGQGYNKFMIESSMMSSIYSIIRIKNPSISEENLRNRAIKMAKVVEIPFREENYVSAVTAKFNRTGSRYVNNSIREGTSSVH
jgi:hypothetical protein